MAQAGGNDPEDPNESYSPDNRQHCAGCPCYQKINPIRGIDLFDFDQNPEQ